MDNSFHTIVPQTISPRTIPTHDSYPSDDYPFFENLELSWVIMVLAVEIFKGGCYVHSVFIPLPLLQQRYEFSFLREIAQRCQSASGHLSKVPVPPTKEIQSDHSLVRPKSTQGCNP